MTPLLALLITVAVVYAAVASVLVRRAAIAHREEQLRIADKPRPAPLAVSDPRSRLRHLTLDSIDRRELNAAASTAKRSVFVAFTWPMSFPVLAVADIPRAISGTGNTAVGRSLGGAWTKLGSPADKRRDTENEHKTRLLVTAHMLSSAVQESRDNDEPAQKIAALAAAADYAWTTYDQAPGVADNHTVAKASAPYKTQNKALRDQ